MPKKPRKLNVVVAGHSFVRRLQDYTFNMPFQRNLGLFNHTQEVKFLLENTLGDRLRTLPDLATDPRAIFQCFNTVDIVVVDLGCNDLNAHEEVNPRFLADYVVDVAECLVAHGAKSVIIAEMMYRSGRGAICRNMSPYSNTARAEEAFNARVEEYNAHVKVLTINKWNISFLHQKGMVLKWREGLDPDGVHLTTQAMVHYASNMGRAIIRTTRKILGQEERQVYY